MSLRQVLTIFKTERELNDDETALLNTMRKWTDAERALFIESLSDKPQKKSSKKSAGKGGGKSKHASSLQQQISGHGQSLIQPPAAATTDDTDDTDDSTNTRCQFTRSDGKLCLLLPDHNIHHMKTANEYHEFQPAEQAAVASGD